MSLATIMLEHLAVARRVVEDGQETVPTWRIETPEGAFSIRTQFDTDNQEQREHTVALISRFMAWKMATSFVFTAETWLGERRADEALLVVGVSHHERLAVLQRIQRGETVGFSEAMWLAPYQIDKYYLKMLPGRRTEITADEAEELASIFGKNGELPPERLS
jgi:hypothetical protein